MASGKKQTATSPKNPRKDQPQKFNKWDDVGSMKIKRSANRKKERANETKSKKQHNQYERRKKLSGFLATSVKVSGGGEHAKNVSKGRKVTVAEPFLESLGLALNLR